MCFVAFSVQNIVQSITLMNFEAVVGAYKFCGIGYLVKKIRGCDLEHCNQMCRYQNSIAIPKIALKMYSDRELQIHLKH